MKLTKKIFIFIIFILVITLGIFLDETNQEINQTTNQINNEIVNQVNSEMAIEMDNEANDQQTEKSEEEKIIEYLGKIYAPYYPEGIMPTFTDINKETTWMLDCAMNNEENIKEYFTKSLIKQNQKELFGISSEDSVIEEYLKEYEQVDASSINVEQSEVTDEILNSNETIYTRTYYFSPGEPEYIKRYILDSISEENGKIVVKIVEYMYNSDIYYDVNEIKLCKFGDTENPVVILNKKDYEYEFSDDDPNYEYIINNYSYTLSVEGNYYSTYMEEIEKYAENNKDKFGTATIVLERNDNNNSYIIKSCQRDF